MMRGLVFPVTWSVCCNDATPALLDGKLENLPLGYPPPNDGNLLNFSSWKMGDIILFLPANRKPHQFFIENVQAASVHRVHAVWTHTAIYVGDGKVCDVTVERGVSRSPVACLLDEGCVRVRRLRGITDQDRCNIATAAVARKGQAYNRIKALIGGLAPHFPARLRQDLSHAPSMGSEAYCSEFVNQVFLAKANTSFRTRSIPWALPASLSLTSLLAEVTIGWRMALLAS